MKKSAGPALTPGVVRAEVIVNRKAAAFGGGRPKVKIKTKEKRQKKKDKRK
jgi:hypothetical protein